MSERWTAAMTEKAILDELIQIGNRNPSVPRRDLDFIATLAIRLRNAAAMEAVALHGDEVDDA